jgi:hypothetical protein
MSTSVCWTSRGLIIKEGCVRFVRHDTLTVAVAQDLLFLILLAAAGIWLFLPRQEKIGLAGQAIVSLVVMVMLIKMAAAIHTDPRPFVVDPSIKPLFPHPGDNGFPPTTPHWG